jgi:uncharacterized protein DUF4169
MGDVVNLRSARKRRAIIDAETRAAANRAEYGVLKSVKGKAEAERVRAASRLDAHRIPGPDDAD